MAKSPYRLSVQPLTEKTNNKAVQDEILVNNTTGHISVINQDGRVSATKNIETELYLQKFWVKQLTDMVEKQLTEINSIIPKFNDADTTEKNFDAQITELEKLLVYIQQILKIVDPQISSNTYDLFQCYKKLVQYIPIFLKDYFAVIDVMRQIDEAKYIYDETVEMMNTMQGDYGNMINYFNTVMNKVNSLATKYEYLNWVNTTLKSYNNWARSNMYHDSNTASNGKFPVYTIDFPTDSSILPNPIGNTTSNSGKTR